MCLVFFSPAGPRHFLFNQLQEKSGSSGSFPTRTPTADHSGRLLAMFLPQFNGSEKRSLRFNLRAIHEYSGQLSSGSRDGACSGSRVLMTNRHLKSLVSRSREILIAETKFEE
jgi:hypothetical protein